MATRFDDPQVTPLDAANINSIDTGLNVFQSPLSGGLFVEVSAGEIVDATKSPTARVLVAALTATLLPPSVASFIFVDATATIVINQTGFPAGDHVPLAKVTTSATTISANEDRRPRVVLGAGGDVPALVYRSGIRYPQSNAQGSGSVALALNTIVAVLYPVARRVTVDQMLFEVIVAGAATTLAQVALYAEDAANPGLPGALIEDLGTILIDSTGIKILPVANKILDRGRIYVALVSGDAAATFRAYTASEPGAALLGIDAAGLDPFGYLGGGAHTVGVAAPDPFPASPTPTVANSPMAALRVA